MFGTITKPIDNFLNRITMYRLMLYFLIAVFLSAVVFCLTNLLPYSPWGLVNNIIVITITSLLVNKVFSIILKIPLNAESDYITALILSLIITPGANLWFLIIAGLMGQASKYIFVYHGKHIFNPAAIAVLITFYAIGQGASWWIGGIFILPIVIVGGILIVRKIQRFDLIAAFLATTLVILAYDSNSDAGLVLKTTLLDSSLLFFTFVMLTEPQTTPTRRIWRIAYGCIIGILYSFNFSVGPIYSSPELALVLGNIFSFIVSSKGRFNLVLESKSEIANGIYRFVFKSNRAIHFIPGQYMEWTLDSSNSDLRGNRRYFTVASSPTEDTIELGVKFYENPSSFKKKLLALDPGNRILASQQAGDFILPREKDKKLAFIAGGIGITPFRSIIKYLIDKNEKRDIILFYSVKNENEIAYKSILEEASSKLGIKVITIETDKVGFLDTTMIQKQANDFLDRYFYISGPRSMVLAFENSLKSMGVSRRQIKKDFFPGYV